MQFPREGELMPRHSPYRVVLTAAERAVLESSARSYTLPYWQVTRAQMALMAADGLRNDQRAARLRLWSRCRVTVAKAVLRAAFSRPRGPAPAGQTAGFYPLWCALR